MLGVKKGNRITLIYATTMLIFVIIVVRLFQLQIIEHQKWLNMAENEAMKQLTIPAKRGEIYAYDGRELVPMVLNESVWLVFLDPTAINNGDKVKSVLKEIIPDKITVDLDEILKEAETGARYRVVARDLHYEEANKIKEANLVGVGLTKSVHRTYPNDEMAAQTLGFVNADGVGQYGVEGYLDEDLRGVDGEMKTVTDVNNIPLTIGNNSIKKPAVDGKNLVLSLDVNVQMMTEKALADQVAKLGGGEIEASAIVMDPRTGRILAMAGNPSFNPGEYWGVEDGNVFNNPVVSSAYEPGSVMKSFTMATGIDTGTVKPTDTYYNADFVKVEDAVIANSHKGQTGNITYQTAIDYSLNTGMVEILRLLGGSQVIGNMAGRTKLYDYFAERFGFGKKINIGLASVEGLIYSPESEYGGSVQYSNMTFGQGMSATMLQVATAFGGLVTNGEIKAPWLVEGYLENKVLVKNHDVNVRRAVSEETAKVLRDMLIKARGGLFTAIDGWTLGGKTGTSETVEDGKYTQDTTDVSYLGFGGKTSDDFEPSFVIMVHFKKKGVALAGNTHAEPAFYEIAKFLSSYLH